MLPHILGEVDTFCAVLLSVPSRTGLPIFITIGLYLSVKKQEISWHVLWDTVYIVFDRVIAE